MKPSKLIIETAIEMARKSTARFRVGSIIFWNGSIEGEGFNDDIKTHPKSPHPFRSIHAEFSAVIDTVRSMRGYGYEPELLKGYSIYTHRLLRNNEPGLAKPCEYCEWMISNVGIRSQDVHYSKGI